jgi:hypothetical protein
MKNNLDNLNKKMYKKHIIYLYKKTFFINIKYKYNLPDPDAMYFPHGLKATDNTSLECPYNVFLWLSNFKFAN